MKFHWKIHENKEQNSVNFVRITFSQYCIPKQNISSKEETYQRRTPQHSCCMISDCKIYQYTLQILHISHSKKHSTMLSIQQGSLQHNWPKHKSHWKIMLFDPRYEYKMKKKHPLFPDRYREQISISPLI